MKIMTPYQEVNVSNCPCCSNQPFSECCEPYLSGKSNAPTPEALMRSRYTAYSMANIEYVADTMKNKALEGFDPVATKQWAERVKWLKLKVTDVSEIQPDSSEGFVEFVATFSENGKAHKIQERSRFIKEDGRWYYVEGVHF